MILEPPIVNELFGKAVLRYFDFLVSELGFEVSKIEKDNYGCLIWYRNKTTALRVSLEIYDGGVFVAVYKLKSGEIPEYPIFFDPGSEFLIFDFNDLLKIRTGQTVQQDAKLIYQGDYLASLVQRFAEAVQKYGVDVLRGDFAILPKIKEAVVRRAKELEDEQ